MKDYQCESVRCAHASFDPGTPPLHDNNQGHELHVHMHKSPCNNYHYACEEDAQAAGKVISHAAHNYLAKRNTGAKCASLGLPVSIRIPSIRDLFFWFDFTHISQMYCDVRVLRKPFGPFMFKYITERCSDIKSPNWEKECFIPQLSSNCDIVVTLIGVTRAQRRLFLGQAIFKLDEKWSERRHVEAVIGNWTFPTTESLYGHEKKVKGFICLDIKRVYEDSFVFGGAFMMDAVQHNSSLSTSSARWWSRSTKIVSFASTSEPMVRFTKANYWGVLTKTNLNIYAQGTADPVMSFQLDMLQLVQHQHSTSPASISPTEDTQTPACPSKLFALKLYAHGKAYVLYMSTYRQFVEWTDRLLDCQKQMSEKYI